MKLVFATHNKSKLYEVRSLMPAYIELLSLTDIGCKKAIPETSKTIEGNAILKANFVSSRYGYNCFADDTGLEVLTLDNAPGVFSARYAGPDNNAEANMYKLQFNLKEKINRKARFKTAIALNINGKSELFLGICEGSITKAPRGEDGFGYDPIFQPKGYTKTFAEMTLKQKSVIGHRGKAVQLLIDYLSTS